MVTSSNSPTPRSPCKIAHSRQRAARAPLVDIQACVLPLREEPHDLGGWSRQLFTDEPSSPQAGSLLYAKRCSSRSSAAKKCEQLQVGMDDVWYRASLDEDEPSSPQAGSLLYAKRCSSRSSAAKKCEQLQVGMDDVWYRASLDEAASPQADAMRRAKRWAAQQRLAAECLGGQCEVDALEFLPSPLPVQAEQTSGFRRLRSDDRIHGLGQEELDELATHEVTLPLTLPLTPRKTLR